METLKPILFSDCIPVKGVNRSIICDTQNNKYYFIPNGLYDILKTYYGETIDFVKKEFNNEYDEIIDEYFVFLSSKKLIFFNSSPDLFPKINLKWNSPSLVTNMIIDYDDIQHDFEDIIQQLEDLKCSYIQLRFFKKTNLNFISNLIQIVNDKKARVISIDFILPYDDSFSKKELDELLNENPRIHAIIIFNAPKEKSYDAIWKKMGYLMFVKKNIINEKHCGILNTEYFYSNIKLFSESQQHNTCLNRKISIDKNGNIKNCPSMPQSFGNVKETTLLEALEHKDFKKYWNITKDQIDVCKDCEFRHICTDCRAYKENSEDDYSKPLKCGYSPYTNEWKEWSTNPLKQKAIEYYGMQDLVKRDD
ncbi:grasp-with-spasm system SPASM domain peptide maturase [Psychroserpens burtonensis]|uniref:grasp-with-spasm system SPASM domain peptide maturase n=1 Tax=Psychroserpens burtonensis TaxID=49278 RepID=UPI0003FB42F4|nr:grasp-with-spasm system SPASM domain peptide maturase [Psychroserpens burtonensis]